MTPTLAGRLQTRLMLLSSVGVAWTLAISALLPRPAGVPLRVAYQITLETAIAMMLFGIIWEFVYHALQQLRWDKDWPSVLALVTGAVEAIPVWLLLHSLRIVPGDGGHSSPILPLYAIHFGSTWLVVWLIAQGPIRVVQPRWRFEGGTFSRRPPDVTLPFVIVNIGTVFALAALWVAWH